MFTVNDDLSIYANRGDIVFFSVSADDNGTLYKFQPGDIVRMSIYGRKEAETCVMQKDFPVTEVTEEVFIYLDEADTKIGEIISKHKDYWYEVVLNPDTMPQTIIGYDEDGAKVFRLFPESKEIDDNYDPQPEDFPVVDEELDMTSPRPIANKVIAKNFATVLDVCERTNAAVAENFVTPEMYGAIGDGEADDTEAIQSALDANKKVVFGNRKTYLVSCDSSGVAIYVNAGTLVDFNYSTVKLSPNARSAYHVVRLANDCTIKNGTIVGDKNEHTGTVGEYGHCVSIHGKNIQMFNMNMTNGWGDGVYISKNGDVLPEDVYLENCKCNENRRNGMSVVAGKGIRINNCSFNYNSGTAPQSGFDIEPNEDDEISVFMDNVECIGNGDSSFCLSNRNSKNCRVDIGKIYTEGNLVYIRSPEKSYFHIKDLHHVSKAITAIHLVGGSETHITIDSFTLDMSDKACTHAFYTEGVYDCSIGDLVILGDTATAFITNSTNCNLKIGRLVFNPTMAGRSIANTNIDIDVVAHKTGAITSSVREPKQFVNEITFDSSINTAVTATIFCRNYPNEFTLKAYNASAVDCVIYCDDGTIVNGTAEASKLTLGAGKLVELKYHKTAGKWAVLSMI